MNKKMEIKKRISDGVKVVSFILVFIVLLEVLSTTVFSKANATTYKNKYKHAYSYVNEKTNTIDIIALGNSDMYSAFCPLKLWDKKGYTSTVVASPRQTVAMSCAMLSSVLEKQSPKFVLLETDMFYEGVDFPTESKEKKKKKRLPVIPYITDEQLTTDIQNHFTVFLLHDRWKKMIYNYTNIGDDARFNHGYYFNKNIKKLSPNDNMKYTKDSEELPEETIIYLDKIIDLCKKNDIQLMFFGAPSLTNWSYARHNAVNEFATDNDIPFLDFNTLDDYEINYKRDFRDKGNHMNYYGAKKITDYIGNYIKENYPNALDDKRENEDYSYWYDDKQKFIEYYNIKKF